MAESMSEAYKEYEVQGDLSVTHNGTVGADLKVRGNGKVGHNLYVGGWLEAENIKDANKGVFSSCIELQRVYPNPQSGWFAIVMGDDGAMLYIAQENGWHYQATTDGLTITTDGDNGLLHGDMGAAVTRTNSEVQIAIPYHLDGEQQVMVIRIPAATGSMAGVMSATDKAALEGLDISGLKTRMTTAESGITTNSNDISGLKTRMTSAEGNISAHSTDIRGLATRMSTAERNLNITAGTAQNALQTAQQSGCYPFDGIQTEQSILPLREGGPEQLRYEIIFLSHGCHGDNTPRFVAKSGLGIYAEWPTSANYVTNTGRPPQSALYSYNNKLYRFNGSALVEAHDMSALEGRIATAEGNIAALDRNVVSLVDDMPTVQSDINELEAALNTAQESIASNGQRITANTQAITLNTQDIERLDEGIDALIARIKNVSSTLNDTNTAVGHQQEELGRLWGDSNTQSTRIGNVESSVSTLQSSLTTARANINALQEGWQDLEQDIASAEYKAMQMGCYSFDGIMPIAVSVQQSSTTTPDAILYSPEGVIVNGTTNSTPRFIAQKGGRYYLSWANNAGYCTAAGTPPTTALYHYNNRLYRFDGSSLVEATLALTDSGSPLHSLFLAAGATWSKNNQWRYAAFNEENAIYRVLNITNEEMAKIVVAGKATRAGIGAFYAGTGIRTNMPPYDYIKGTAERYYMDCSNLEVANLGWYFGTDSIKEMFSGCTSLRAVWGSIVMDNVVANAYTNAFEGCTSLQRVYLSRLTDNISFADSPLLDDESLQYLIDYAANESKITVYLHPHRYTSLTSQMRSDAAAKNISFAISVPKPTTDN